MIIEALGPFLLWEKSLHVISVIAWMAGLFYLPRLYVYHCASPPGSARSEMLKGMERRLLRQIMNPAMVLSFGFGILLVLTPGAVDWHAGWWWVKLTSALLLAGFHGACASWRRAFAEDRNVRTGRFFRFANEIPTVLMVVIVLMAIVQPF